MDSLGYAPSEGDFDYVDKFVFYSGLIPKLGLDASFVAKSVTSGGIVFFFFGCSERSKSSET